MTTTQTREQLAAEWTKILTFAGIEATEANLQAIGRQWLTALTGKGIAKPTADQMTEQGWKWAHALNPEGR